ncbi:MAG: hypothetical protein NXI31_24700 [bacterium]|nr:hypothetical protein [bacterium]
MRIQSTIAALLVLGLGAAELSAQRTGGGRNRNNSRWNVPEEITNRVAMFFNDVDGPATDGDKVADLATVELVRTAMSANQLTLLYIVDQNNEAHSRSRLRMEWQLTANYELGIAMRFFHCGRIDLGKSEALKKRYEKKAPLFVAFSPTGKEFEVPMAGYRAAGSKLKAALDKASSGTKPPVKTFAKKYGKLMKDYYELLTERQKVQKELAEAAGDKGKQKKADKELMKLATAEQKILAEEQKQLAKVTFPERGKHRLGRFGGRQGRGNRAGGDGNGDGGGGQGGRRGGND